MNRGVMSHPPHQRAYILAIEPRHTAALITMPYHHKDPFDRLLIAQAIVEGIRLVSADAIIHTYGVPRIW